MLACQAVVFEAGRNLASKSAFVSLRRDSLRLSCLKAKAGGKGIRTPGLLIANETLYQLSYTPEMSHNQQFNDKSFLPFASALN